MKVLLTICKRGIICIYCIRIMIHFSFRHLKLNNKSGKFVNVQPNIMYIFHSELLVVRYEDCIKCTKSHNFLTYFPLTAYVMYPFSARLLVSYMNPQIKYLKCWLFNNSIIVQYLYIHAVWNTFPMQYFHSHIIRTQMESGWNTKFMWRTQSWPISIFISILISFMFLKNHWKVCKLFC